MAKTGVQIVVKSNRLPQMPALIRAAVVQEVSTATLQVEAKSKALVPVKTGALRRSIHSVFENGGLTGLVGPSVSYGKFVEFGTRRMGARPYMRPAAAQVLPGFADAVKRALAGIR